MDSFDFSEHGRFAVRSIVGHYMGASDTLEGAIAVLNRATREDQEYPYDIKIVDQAEEDITKRVVYQQSTDGHVWQANRPFESLRSLADLILEGATRDQINQFLSKTRNDRAVAKNKKNDDAWVKRTGQDGNSRGPVKASGSGRINVYST